jgi:hypothetical protein
MMANPSLVGVGTRLMSESKVYFSLGMARRIFKCPSQLTNLLLPYQFVTYIHISQKDEFSDGDLGLVNLPFEG